MGDFFKTIFGALGGPFFLFVGLGIMYYVFTLLNVRLEPILSVVVALTPIWLPIVLFYVLFEQWMYYVQGKFKFNNGRSTLRIKLPQEVLKSPEAMESVFTQIFNTNPPDNLMQTYIDGKHPLVSSFELASIGGEVRFYANVPTKKVKNALEAQLYAQFPGIEVFEEMIDYTAEIKWDPSTWDLMSFHITKKGEDIFPIKTYLDFGLDRQPKEELKFEPMAPLLENLGKTMPYERMWVQILMVPHTEKVFKNGSLSKISTWESRAKKKIDEIMKREGSSKLGVEETESRPTLTMNERDTIGAIERNVGKYAYEVVIRAMYITPPDKFDADKIGLLLKGFTQFDIIGRNALGVRWRTDFDYNFISDRSGRRKTQMKKNELEAYKARYYDYADKKNGLDKPKVMSVEELATLYHIPGTSVVTPAVSRVESTRKEAPSNLPTGNL